MALRREERFEDVALRLFAHPRAFVLDDQVREGIGLRHDAEIEL